MGLCRFIKRENRATDHCYDQWEWDRTMRTELLTTQTINTKKDNARDNHMHRNHTRTISALAARLPTIASSRERCLLLSESDCMEASSAHVY